MARYILRRVGQAAVVLLGVSVIVFALMQLVPGDPVRVALGTRFDQETYDALRARSGLDQPLLVQYVQYLGNALRGDLGVSFRSGQPVTQDLVERLPATLSLAGVSLLLALLIAVPLGLVSATRSGKLSDYVATIFSQIGVSIPDFWMAILLILLFTSTLGWLPPSGYIPFTEAPLGWAEHIAMPAITVGVVSGSILTRFVRSAVLESMGQEHVRTATSKGLPGGLVLRRHVLRGALVPILTITGIQLATLLGGVVVVEVIFAWPGLGRLTYDAVEARDYPLMQGAVLMFAAIFLLVNLVVDLLYAALDPRIGHR
ncbi:MAG: ABC transporter permease [Actinomycetota bacterium]|nr:ABC transporter permease [Actinomycetota bacterium]